ncbi:MAG: glycoside hydrolase family 65 protein [Bacteroidales bacterium]|nr:glycoside hydrolase family 65 protein [Bacteroidales bacterium]
MKAYYKVDEWRVIEEGFDPLHHEASESIFSLGNGHMGQRANFEEKYSGKSLQGTYIAGIYHPDKTRVGWWKNGYPEYFAKVPNAPNWTGIRIIAGKEELDLHTCKTSEFIRELDMQHGCLNRSFVATFSSGKKMRVVARRFLSMAEDDIGAVRYAVTPVNFDGTIEMIPFLDGNVINRDTNYDEQFWDIIESGVKEDTAYLRSRVRKSGFEAGYAMQYTVEVNGKPAKTVVEPLQQPGYNGFHLKIKARANEEVVLYKYAAILSSLDHKPDLLVKNSIERVTKAARKKFDKLYDNHVAIWEKNWAQSDIIIKGDAAAQQGIRFNIFQLNQTYTGKDERLNIGPKGFTGEKYGGSTYWDTEAFLIPFYLSTEPPEVARNLLIYRFKHLQKAIENAEKLGFNAGAALYPMVTMNGEECHNEWEITFEEIHRNGAIAFAIYNYIRYTGDKDYLAEYGLEVLIALARFWRQRVNWSDVKGKYVILGVTGPNEYENNVNNNWYTNKMAAWTLRYTIECLDYVMDEHPLQYQRIVKKTHLYYDSETSSWKDIIKHMYFPMLDERGIFLQQDGYMDKEQRMVAELSPKERPINQHWSWDRILRSVFIKQADVLQGIFCFEDEYTTDTIRRNFDFYEPRTVHESSLSPCIHSILANRIGEVEKAYDLYLRTSRLDLDDYNNEVAEGLHITSMGGTWMSMVIGFGGMRIKEGMLTFTPNLPHKWKLISFNIQFRGRILNVTISENKTSVKLVKGEKLQVEINGKLVNCTHENNLLT